jgi:hypothetical protein
MALNKLKCAFVLSLTLAILACNTSVPNNNMIVSPDNFQDLEKEYTFSSKILTQSYLKRKIDKWLTEPINGHALVKELAYAKSKQSQLFCEIIKEDPLILENINSIEAVKERILIDSNFATFLDSCIITPPFIGEFQVNTTTTFNQTRPAIAMDDNGDFVITWQSNSQNGDYIGVDIYGQRYNSLGSAVGSEFQVNTHTMGRQYGNSVAMDSDGDFVVTWTSSHFGGNYEVYAQRYNSSGSANGSEFQVNNYTTGYQEASTVAMDNNGDFVIAWDSQDQDGYLAGIFAQKYNSSGSAVGSEFQVNTFTSYSQQHPIVAMDGKGDFVIAWMSVGQESDYYGIFAQRYNSSGTVAGTEFKVNTYTPERQRETAIAMDNSGDFVIVWGSQYQDGNNWGLFAQRYNTSGAPNGSEFQVNTYTTGYQGEPSVSMDNAGDFIITWTSGIHDLDDYYGIFAQRYNSTGSAVGSEFLVNSNTTSGQWSSAVAMDNNGDFVITWNSYNNPVGDDYGIEALRYNSLGIPQ